MKLAIHMKNIKTGEERIKRADGSDASMKNWSCKDFGYTSEWRWTGTEPWTNVSDSVEYTGKGYYKRKEDIKPIIKNATITSVWRGGLTVTTNCKVDTETHKIFDIEKVDGDERMKVLEREYITLDGVDYDAYCLECDNDTVNENDYWYR